MAARTAQGYDECSRSTEDERLDAVRRWHDIQLELGKEKHQVKHHKTPPPCRFLKTRHLSYDDNTKTTLGKKAQKKVSKHKGNGIVPEVESAPTPLHHAQTYPRVSSAHPESSDFEEAIKMSIATTSKGNSDEDALVEKAIRASIAELQCASQEGDEDEALTRAIQASVVSAAQYQHHSKEYLEQLHAALHSSVHQYSSLARRPTDIVDTDFDDSGVDTDDDENIKIALESSKKLHDAGHRDTDLQRALHESKQLHDEREKGLEKQMTEEEIVLEYVKRQSLAEEKFRQSSETAHQGSSIKLDRGGDSSERTD